MAESDVRIVHWPDGGAVVRHTGTPDQPIALSIALSPKPAVGVVLRTEQTLDVRMPTTIRADQAVPLCIDVCEPICSSSDYRAGITLLDQLIGNVAVRGGTRIERCAARPDPVHTCQRFEAVPTTGDPLPVVARGDLRVRGINGLLRAISGPPDNSVTVMFPDTGVRIEFRDPSHDVTLLARNFGGELTLRVLTEDGARTERPIELRGEIGTIAIEESGVTVVELRGGSNEAGVIEVCYTPDRPV